MINVTDLIVNFARAESVCVNKFFATKIIGKKTDFFFFLFVKSFYFVSSAINKFATFKFRAKQIEREKKIFIHKNLLGAWKIFNQNRKR